MSAISKKKETTIFCIAVAVLHFIVGIFGILNHEIWLDEAHHFLLARDSTNFTELARNARYDGHPLLWNSLLFLTTRFSGSVMAMQVLNISIMSFCVFLFLRHAPFKKIISVLIVFGYFFIYEYHIISRNYAISLLFLTLVFIELNKPEKRHGLILFYLLLLSFTHLYAIILVVTLSMILIYTHKSSRIRYAYVAMILMSLALLCILNVPADHFLFKYDTDPYLSIKRVGKAFSVYLKGFLPVPDFTEVKVWNTNLLATGSKAVGMALSVICAVLPFYIFRREKVILFFFYFSTLLICLFIYLTPIMVATRHCGFFYVILVFSFWLRKILYPSIIEFKVLYREIVVVILCIHVAAGIYLFSKDLRYPFSNAKNVATFLTDRHLEGKEIYLSNLNCGPSVSAYLKQKITYIETGEKNSFCKWNTWPFKLSETQLVETINRLVKTDSAVLILNQTEVNQSLNLSKLNFDVVPLISYDQAMVQTENYDVYYLTRKKTKR